MTIRWAAALRTAYVEGTKNFRLILQRQFGALEDDPSVQIAVRLAVPDVPADLAEPTIEWNRPGHATYTWPDAIAEQVEPREIPLEEWSGYVADGIHHSPLCTADESGAITQHDDNVTWLDGERIPVWGILAARNGLD